MESTAKGPHRFCVAPMMDWTAYENNAMAAGRYRRVEIFVAVFEAIRAQNQARYDANANSKNGMNMVGRLLKYWFVLLPPSVLLLPQYHSLISAEVMRETLT